MTRIAAAGVAGHLVQVVDPAEETLPYSGRVEFQEMAGPLKYLAGKTESLREAYQRRSSTPSASALRDIATPHRLDLHRPPHR